MHLCAEAIFYNCEILLYTLTMCVGERRSGGGGAKKCVYDTVNKHVSGVGELHYISYLSRI